MRGVAGGVLLLLMVASVAWAQNVSVNGTLSGGMLELKGKPTAPALSALNRCRFYANSTSDALLVSCNGGLYKTILGTTATSCSEAADGTLTCKGFVSSNQGPATANALRIYANPTPQPCSAAGVWGQLTLTQTTPGGTYCWCNGQQLLSCIAGTPVPTPTSTP